MKAVSVSETPHHNPGSDFIQAGFNWQLLSNSHSNRKLWVCHKHQQLESNFKTFYSPICNPSVKQHQDFLRKPGEQSLAAEMEVKSYHHFNKLPNNFFLLTSSLSDSELNISLVNEQKSADTERLLWLKVNWQKNVFFKIANCDIFCQQPVKASPQISPSVPSLPFSALK